MSTNPFEHSRCSRSFAPKKGGASLVLQATFSIGNRIDVPNGIEQLCSTNFPFSSTPDPTRYNR
ncbi:MAG: hypothetical protein WB511_09235 [Nitrososphaeraceae archaeon]